ncbi:hypothetical protein L2E82_44353 [Cichorium intybus]|uniref:Uncharacterized protein n=1 Tax=Cichorium intybus TaxID=13427 RepID=A0ACB8ZUL3_CICIN|nr:hypothetical protein L2E82_44353 [Cichorium intybus]
MEQQGKIKGLGLSPSFSFYTSDTSTSMAAAKFIREEQAARFHEFGDVDEGDFEFPLEFSDDEISANEIDSRGWTVFPVFNRDLLVKDEVKTKDDEIHASDSITSPLRKLKIDEREESTSCSSSEADELEALPSGTYCVWKPKADGGSSPDLSKIKKSSSTGSGSKRWGIRYLLRRSNSEGKEPVVLLTPKKVDSPKQKRNSGEVSKVAGRLKSQTPLQFYMEKRAENEAGKRKSFLPYRQVGLFTNVSGLAKMIPF